MEVLFHNVEEVVALFVEDLLAAADGQDLALDAQDGCAIGELDVEIIAGKGQDFLL